MSNYWVKVGRKSSRLTWRVLWHIEAQGGEAICCCCLGAEAKGRRRREYRENSHHGREKTEFNDVPPWYITTWRVRGRNAQCITGCRCSLSSSDSGFTVSGVLELRGASGSPDPILTPNLIRGKFKSVSKLGAQERDLEAFRSTFGNSWNHKYSSSLRVKCSIVGNYKLGHCLG